ncbi:MAG: hypothetical protein IJN25_09945 [Clostridia bacterium]|nr:hypothetical protein [Clostridia bacterium]
MNSTMEQTVLKLGYAEADITPDGPVELVGFNRTDATSRGILRPLLAQISLWEEKERGVLITIDSLGFKKELTDILRNLVCEALGITREKVMVCFSHTHAAPNADTTPGYFSMVCDKIISAVTKIKNHLVPVHIGCINCTADIGVNRRNQTAEVDKRIGLLKICPLAETKPKLLILRVTAHCNVLKRDNFFVSPDYFGAVRDTLTKRYNCPVMVIQGAAGNVAPKYYASTTIPSDGRSTQYVRTDNALQEMSNAVLSAVEQKIQKIVLQTAAFQMYAKEIVLRAEVPTIETAEKIAHEAKQICGIDGAAWLKEVRKLSGIPIKWREETAEVHYLTLGQWCLCGVPYELMTEFSLEAAKNQEYFYLNGYTNGCSTYFPTAEEFDKGGYEIYWAMLLYYKYYNRVYPLEKISAEKLLTFVKENQI